MMEVTSATLLLAVACTLGGIAIGALLARRFSTHAEHRRQLAETLRRKEEEAAHYQQKVTAHFIKTSELVSDLAQSYRAFHQHVTTGAMTLTTPEVGRKLLNAAAGQLEFSLDPKPDSAQAIEPPKDYSPRNGMLSARYGLDESTVVEDSPSPGDSRDDPALRDDPTLKVG